jgi:hypothetical protein
MLALFVLRPYGGTTTFALGNAWPRCSLFWSFGCGYTALAWAGYASATGDLHRQEVGLTIITSTQELASAALPFPGQLPVKRRVGKAYTGLGPSTWHPPILAVAQGILVVKLQRPFHVCLASLLVLCRGTECKGRPRLKTCKQTFSPATPALTQNRLSSPPTPHPLHCGKSS